MTIIEPLAFWGNVIPFVAVTVKSVFDLLINPYFFRTGEKTLGLIEAAKRKRSRSDISILLTFIVLGIGYAFSIAALIKL